MNQHQNDEEPFPLSFLDAQNFMDFSTYQKSMGEGYISRAQKRNQRVLRLTKYLHDPEQKKLKKLEQKQAQKEKMHRIIDQMSEEEARNYLDAIKKTKAQRKQKVRDAMGWGQTIILDLVYEQKMNEKENRSLAKQVELIMRVIKQFEQPPSIHLCNFTGRIQQQMEKMGYKYWAVTVHPQDVIQAGKKLGKRLVYLSPDASLELERVEQDAAYILGGLVDRTVLKDASLKRANELGLEVRRLPIAQFMKGRLCLNLDHVFKECKDWRVAFDFSAPKRWKKQESKQESQSKGKREKEKRKWGKVSSQEEQLQQKKEKVPGISSTGQNFEGEPAFSSPSCSC